MRGALNAFADVIGGLIKPIVTIALIWIFLGILGLQGPIRAMGRSLVNTLVYGTKYVEVKAQDEYAQADAEACHIYGEPCPETTDDGSFAPRRERSTTAPYAEPTSPASPTTAVPGTPAPGTTPSATEAEIIALLVTDPAQQPKVSCEDHVVNFVCMGTVPVDVTHPGGGKQLDYYSGFDKFPGCEAQTVDVGTTRQARCTNAAGPVKIDHFTFWP